MIRVSDWDFTDFRKYVVSFSYGAKTKLSELASFSLVESMSNTYHVGSFEFTKKCDARLKNLWLHIIVENMIERAKKALMDGIIIITRDASVVDVFLEFGFAVRKVGTQTPIYKGRKSLTGVAHEKKTS